MKVAKITLFVFSPIVLVAIISASIFYDNTVSYKNTVSDVVEKMVEEEEKGEIRHIKTPDAVKAIYMTSCVVGTPTFREKLVGHVGDTELNSIVIDIKDFSGTLSYRPNNSELLHAWEEARCGASDMKEFIQELHDLGIYVIGRVTVFQDPHLVKIHPEWGVQFASTGALWEDYKGLNFLDVGAKGVWDYHIEIASDAYQIGFDEINFDYIRYPSDGPMKDIYFPHSQNKQKQIVLEEFFNYLSKNLKEKYPEIVISADLFGMTTTSVDDLNIGQVWERALPYFDFIAPMVYPSHYPKNFNGWANPNDYPYELIHFVLGSAIERTTATSSPHKIIGSQPIASTTPQLYTKESYSKDKIRTWIQDFDYGGDYGVAEVSAQIKAAGDLGLDSYMVWDPGNTYTIEVYKRE